MFDCLILSAGLGTRLRPLTDKTPKPLVPYFGVPLLYCALSRVNRISGGRIFINTHHLSEKINQFIDTISPAQRKLIQVNFEKELLGTGGPLAVVHKQSQADDLLVYNSDCIQTIDLEDLYATHKKSGCAATMALLADCPPGKNPVYAQNGRVVGIGFNEKFENKPFVTRHTLSGIHFVGREFRDAIPQNKFFDVRDTYQKFINNTVGVGAFIYEGPWFDLGEPKDYWAAHESILNNPNGSEFLHHIGVAEYLDSCSPGWKLRTGATKLKYFDLSESPEDFMGNYILNFTKSKIDLHNYSRILLIEESEKNILKSDRIFAGEACFEI